MQKQKKTFFQGAPCAERAFVLSSPRSRSNRGDPLGSPVEVRRRWRSLCNGSNYLARLETYFGVWRRVSHLIFASMFLHTSVRYRSSSLVLSREFLTQNCWGLSTHSSGEGRASLLTASVLALKTEPILQFTAAAQSTLSPMSLRM